MSTNGSGDYDKVKTVSYSHQDSPCLPVEVGMMMRRIQCHITSGQSIRSGDDEEENTMSYHIGTVYVYQQTWG